MVADDASGVAPDATSSDATSNNPSDGGGLMDAAPPVDSGSGAPDSSVADSGGSQDALPQPDTGIVPTRLTVTPNFVSVSLATNQVLSVNAPPGSAVTWTVNNVVGGSTQLGTIAPDAIDSRTATFSAPARAIAVPVTVTVRATIPGFEGAALITLISAAPNVGTVTPASIDVGAPDTVITIAGVGFDGSSRVALDGIGLTIRSVTWTQIEAVVPNSILGIPGERRLVVRNPPPGGGTLAVTFPVVLRQSMLQPGVPAAAPMLFGMAMTGVDLARRPTITYPEDGSIAPLDFPAPVVSWGQPAPSNICRVSLRSPAVAIDIYTTNVGLPPQQNPSATVAPAMWSTIVTTAFGPLSMRVTVACAEVAGATIPNGTIYESLPVDYVVLPTSAGGRIVYFSGLIEGLWRIDIGGNNVVAEPWIGPDPAFRLQTPQCVGCHSFSADGRKLSYAIEAVIPWALELVDVVTSTPAVAVPGTQGAEAVWTAMHPSGDWVLATGLASTIVLLSGTTGQVVGPVPTGAAGTNATQAFWSPRGDQFVFVSGNEGLNGVSDFANGQVWTMDFSVSAMGVPQYGAPTLLAGPDVAGGTAYYPSYSPDGEWVAFCRAPTGSSYNNPNATLWLVRADGTFGPVRLDAANRVGPLSNSWPRWAPTNAGGRYWLVFSSQRGYPPLNGTGPQQLWITHIDPTQITGDPSSPAIWLSGQAPFTGNLTAEWTIAR